VCPGDWIISGPATGKYYAVKDTDFRKDFDPRIETIQRILRLIAEHDCHNTLFWRSDLKFYINCNDAFCWATSDAEPIESEADIDLLQKSMEEGGDDGPLLYCARRRGMRPQGAMYTYLEPEHWPLFDACGPKREVGFGNPAQHPGDQASSTPVLES